jgi:hypothetical protein
VIVITLNAAKRCYFSIIMYRIGRDHSGMTLVCSACPYTERVREFDRSIGNPRTLAAQAMLKHVHAEHSREIHVRGMARVMELARASIALPLLYRKKTP